MSPSESDMLRAAEELSRRHMEGYKDPSHDWLHVDRVRNMALKIGKAEQDSCASPSTKELDMLVVELAALFHDLHDSKYASATTSAWEDLNERFFHTHIAAGTISEERARLVAQICDNVSYSKEVKRIKAGLQTPWHETCKELHIVQDSDKLDAMGGIGILRCAAFSAAKHRPLYEAGNPSDSVSHFHDKLFKLKGMMRTDEGKRLAGKRHQCMVDFIANIEEEMRC